jgi:O-glycosyl hydrolase
MNTREKAEQKVRIDLKNTVQLFEGWGTTLAWWGNAIGEWSDAEKKDRLLRLVFDPVEGLGLNIVRYNIGGGENPAHAHMRVCADIPGYQPAPGVWNWEADAAQRGVLQKAWELGADILEAFSNAPPYWMTKSGCAAGSPDGSSNLKEEHYDAFVDYLVEVVGHFRDSWEISFDTLSPMNEPVSKWWKSTNNQEGCHFSRAEQERIIGKLAARLAKAGLEGIRISAPEENSIEQTIKSFSSYDNDVKSKIGQLNTHTYNGKSRKELKQLAERHGKKLWMSEVSLGGTEEHSHEDMTGALELARRIVDDINGMEVPAWVYWQAVEDEAGKLNHGLIHANFKGEEEYWTTKQYYTMGNFSRFIRPGYRILKAGGKNVLAACDPAAGKAVIILVNNAAKPKRYSIDLINTVFDGGRLEIFRTSKDENLKRLEELTMQRGCIEYAAKENSITTFSISRV